MALFLLYARFPGGQLRAGAAAAPDRSRKLNGENTIRIWRFKAPIERSVVDFQKRPKHLKNAVLCRSVTDRYQPNVKILQNTIRIFHFAIFITLLPLRRHGFR